MAKRISGNIGLVDGTSTDNYIKQITVEGTNHDLALTKKITFFNGETEVSWDGTSELEVVIPTLGDIVANPVTLKGVIDSQGAGAPAQPQNGDLVYIGENCTFASQICEAGDMAIYYSGAWHVISGENQITLAGTSDASGNKIVSLTSEPTTVATVEGKELKLGVDFSSINSAISLTKNGSNTISLANGEVTVPGMYITLAQATGTTNDISTEVSIDLPTVLASGLVTISDKVLQAADFTFTSGAYPTISKNAAAIAVTTSHSMSIGKASETDGTTGDYLTSVSAIKAVSLSDGAEGDYSIKYVSALSAIAGTSFVSGIHAWTQDDGEKAADLVIPSVTVDTSSNTFATGWDSELGSASGEVVSSITVGAVTVGTGNDVLTGLSGGGSSVITAVDFGSVVQDTNAQWFFSGLGEASTSGDVVTGVTVGATSLEADNNSSFAGTAMTTASVSNHVLSFSTGSFMTPVKLSKVADTVNYKSFTKSGAKLSGTSATPTDFTTGGISQATTTVSYKSLTTGAVNLTAATTSYYFDKAEDHNYEEVYGYKKVSTTDATFTKNSPKLENTTITASIPANAVAVDLNAGTLPTFTVGTATGTISGEVGTALTKSSVSWLGIDPAKKNIDVAGEYTLTTANASGDGVVEVAASGVYAVSGNVTIAADTYVTDVDIVAE